MWKGLNPIDQCLHAFGVCRRVVGIVRDVRWDLSRAPVPHFYIPIAQSPRQFGRVIYVRTAARATSADVMDLERASAPADTSRAPPRLYRVADRLDLQLRPLRAASGLLLAYALLILCSACVGLYGKLTFDASQRTRELGVRAALGATRSELAGLLLGSGMRLLVGGLALGIALVVASAGLSARFLFDTSGSDPLILGVVVTILFLTGTSAMLVASRRATALDPAAALRAE